MHARSRAALTAAVLLATLPFGAHVPAAQDRLTPAVLDALPFRNFGPFRAGAWITDFAVPAAPERSHRYTLYVGTRNGGVWKTENGGTTFRSIFAANLPLGEVYAVAVNMDDPYHLHAGLQDHESWRARSMALPATSGSNTGKRSAPGTGCTTPLTRATAPGSTAR